MSLMRSETEILSTISTILREVLRIPEARITPDARLFPDLGSESLDIIDLRFRMEQIFGIRLEEREIVRSLGEGLSRSEIEQKLTVARLVDFIAMRLEKKRAESVPE